AKRGFVQIARAATCATQSLFDAARCGNVRVSHPRAHLGPAESAEGAACSSVDRSGLWIGDRHGSTVLHHGNSGQIPSSEQLIHDASVRPERKIVAVIRHEALWTAELRRTVLLPRVVCVI